MFFKGLEAECHVKEADFDDAGRTIMDILGCSLTDYVTDFDPKHSDHKHSKETQVVLRHTKTALQKERHQKNIGTEADENNH